MLFLHFYPTIQSFIVNSCLPFYSKVEVFDQIVRPQIKRRGIARQAEAEREGRSRSDPGPQIEYLEGEDA
jgi:hypothetical protein